MIYFIRQVSTGYIKIGWSIRPIERFISLQEKFGELHLIGVMSTPENQERRLHERFESLNVVRHGEKKRIYGREWFVAQDALVGYIGASCSLEILNLHISRLSPQRKNQFFVFLDTPLQEWYTALSADREL